MEKNNQPLIITAMILGVILIISLAFIFTRNGEETTSEITNPGNTGEIEEMNEGEEEENGQQTPPPQPIPEPTLQPEPQPAPDPQINTLPSNWDQLTSQQKTNLNPFDCDIETQWISSEDGQCITKSILPNYPSIPAAISAFIFEMLDESCIQTPKTTVNPAANITQETFSCQVFADSPATNNQSYVVDDDLQVDIYTANQSTSADVESLLREVFTPRPGWIAPIDDLAIGTCEWWGTIFVIGTIPILEGNFVDDSAAVSGTWIRVKLFGVDAWNRNTSLRQLLNDNDFRRYEVDFEDDRIIPEGSRIYRGCGNFSTAHYGPSAAL